MICGYPRELWQRGSVNWTCLSVSVVCVCVYLERKDIDWQPPSPSTNASVHTVSGTELFKKWSSAGHSPPSGTLIERTPDLQSVLSWCTRKKIVEGLGEGVRDALCLKKIWPTLRLVPPLTAAGRNFMELTATITPLKPKYLQYTHSIGVEEVWCKCMCVCVHTCPIHIANRWANREYILRFKGEGVCVLGWNTASEETSVCRCQREMLNWAEIIGREAALWEIKLLCCFVFLKWLLSIQCWLINQV